MLLRKISVNDCIQEFFHEVKIRVDCVLRRGNSWKNVGKLEIRKSMVHEKNVQSRVTIPGVPKRND